MRQYSVMGALLLVIGLLVGGYVAGQAKAQTTTLGGADGFLPWPQHPKDIVNLDIEKTLVPGEYFTIYEVPANRLLVVSAFLFTGSTIDLHESVEGVRTRKLATEHSALFSGQSRFGNFLAFQPGSTVEVQNTHTSNTLDFVFQVNGFLVRP